MNFKSLLVALLATSVGFVAHAESTTGETKTKVEGQNSVEGNLDNEITNAKMRAESGSKSKYSASLSVGYDGGTVRKPFAKERKNLLGDGDPEQVALGVGVSGRYRLNKNTSIKAGIGIDVIQPFHSAQESLGHDEYIDKSEVSNPFINVSSYRRMGNWMVSADAGSKFFTSKQDTRLGKLAQLDSSVYGLYDFKNGLQAGMVVSVFAKVYDGSNNVTDTVDMGLTWNPLMEYVINDTFNLRTVWNFSILHTRRSQADGDHALNGATRQSFGLGIAATRDIFLYPNFQINTGNFYADTTSRDTSVGLSASINIF